MKLRVFFIFIALGLSPFLRADNAIPVGGAPDLSPDEAASGSLVISDKDLEYVLDDPSAMVKYDRCKELVGAATLNTDVSTCLWEGKYKDKDGKEINNPNLRLSESEQEKVAERLNSISTGGREPASDDKKFESQDLNFLQKANNEPAFQAIRDHMVKKLNETIFGEAEKGKLKVSDHRIYHELYKSQLSKNVIQAMSSYCLDANPDNNFLVSSDPSDARKKNLDNLKSQEMKDSIDPKTGKVIGQKTIAKANFDTCIFNLKNICYGTGGYAKTRNDKGKLCENDEGEKVSSPAGCHDDYSNSKRRACNVVTYIKQLKQNIVAVGQIEERLDELEGKNKGEGLGLDREQQLETGSRTEKVELITNMSSKEFIEESGFKEKANEELAEFQKCYTNTQTDPDADPEWEFTGDEEACKKFLNENKEEASKYIAEADSRTRALGLDIKKTLEDSQPGVEAYLKDQAYTQDEIKKITGDPELVENIKKQIEERYAAERQALIDSLADRLKDKTSEDGKFDPKDPTGKGKDAEKLEKIGDELVGRTRKYTELIHFNNIVSGYLETDDGKGNSGYNTTAAAMELENTALRSPASGDGGATPVDTEAIKAAMEAAGVKPELDEDKSNTLKQSDINKILQYDGVKDE